MLRHQKRQPIDTSSSLFRKGLQGFNSAAPNPSAHRLPKVWVAGGSISGGRIVALVPWIIFTATTLCLTVASAAPLYCPDEPPGQTPYLNCGNRTRAGCAVSERSYKQSLVQEIGRKKDEVLRRRASQANQGPQVDYNALFNRAADVAAGLLAKSDSELRNAGCPNIKVAYDNAKTIINGAGEQIANRIMQVELAFQESLRKIKNGSAQKGGDERNWIQVPDPEIRDSQLAVRKARKLLLKPHDGQRQEPYTLNEARDNIAVVRNWIADHLERRVLSYIAGSDYIERIYGRPLPPPGAAARPSCPSAGTILGLYQGFAPDLLNLYRPSSDPNSSCPAPGPVNILRSFPGWEGCRVINPFNHGHRRLRTRPGEEPREERYSQGKVTTHDNRHCDDQSMPEIDAASISNGYDLLTAANYLVRGYYVELHFQLLDVFKKEIHDHGRIPSPAIFSDLLQSFEASRQEIKNLRKDIREQFEEMKEHAKGEAGPLDCMDLEGGYAGAPSGIANGEVTVAQTGLRSNQMRICYLQNAQMRLEAGVMLEVATRSFLNSTNRLSEFLKAAYIPPPNNDP